MTYDQYDGTALVLHCLAGGMSEEDAEAAVDNVRRAIAFQYNNDLALWWTPRMQDLDKDGMLSGAPNCGTRDLWERVFHVYTDTHAKFLPSPSVRIATLQFNGETGDLVGVDLIPFALPEVTHETGA